LVDFSSVEEISSELKRPTKNTPRNDLLSLVYKYEQEDYDEDDDEDE